MASESVPAGSPTRCSASTDRVAAVAGGGSGLGAAMAHGLAQAGAQVVVVDVDEEGAQKVAAEIAEAAGGTAP